MKREKRRKKEEGEEKMKTLRGAEGDFIFLGRTGCLGRSTCRAFLRKELRGGL
jgi:hypothetical protein